MKYIPVWSVLSLLLAFFVFSAVAVYATSDPVPDYVYEHVDTITDTGVQVSGRGRALLPEYLPNEFSDESYRNAFDKFWQNLEAQNTQVKENAFNLFFEFERVSEDVLELEATDNLSEIDLINNDLIISLNGSNRTFYVADQDRNLKAIIKKVRLDGVRSSFEVVHPNANTVLLEVPENFFSSDQYKMCQNGEVCTTNLLVRSGNEEAPITTLESFEISPTSELTILAMSKSVYDFVANSSEQQGIEVMYAVTHDPAELAQETSTDEVGKNEGDTTGTGETTSEWRRIISYLLLAGVGVLGGFLVIRQQKHNV